MKQFKISITNGKTFAPAMIVNAENSTKAEVSARSLSGLGGFNSWFFEAIEMQPFFKTKKRN